MKFQRNDQKEEKEKTLVARRSVRAENATKVRVQSREWKNKGEKARNNRQQGAKEDDVAGAKTVVLQKQSEQEAKTSKGSCRGILSTRRLSRAAPTERLAREAS